MSIETNSSVFLVYRFRIRPQKAFLFQSWATTSGMPFWESNPGILRYRTFRITSELTLQPYLRGYSAQIDGMSQVEAESWSAIQRVITSDRFEMIQQEFLSFIEHDSLDYSILTCTYDSLDSKLNPKY